MKLSGIFAKPSVVFAVKKWSTILGSSLLTFPLGIPWYWGNTSVYALSYVLHRLPDSSGLESPWVLSLGILVACLGLFTSAVTTRYLGKRITIFFGSALFSAGWVAVYYAINSSLLGMNVVVGGVVTLGSFVLEGPAMLYAVEWCQDDAGVAMAIVQNGFAVGAIFINQFVTLYVNPDDMRPDKQIGPSKFFSQDQVVERVPSTFLFLAGISVSVNLIGFLMVRAAPESKEEKEKAKKTKESEQSEKTKLHNGSIRSKNKQQSDCNDFENDGCKAIESLEKALADGETDIGMDKEREKGDNHHTATDLSKMTTTDSPTEDLSPIQVFRKPSLYYYWTIFVALEVTYIVVNNYYKSYGQLFIEDDHFLTDLSTGLLVAVVISRIFWGLMMDKYGLRPTLIVIFSASAILVLFFYFAPLVDKWCFVGASIAMGCLSNPMFIIMAYAVNTSYGKTHFIFNFGFVLLPSAVINLVLPVLIQNVLVNLGWFYVFGLCSLCAFVGLIVVIFKLH